MMTDNPPQIVADYLDRLGAEASRRLPAERADELVTDIRDHLRQAVGDDASEADARNAVDRLGSPSELVDEAGGSTPTPDAGPTAYAAPPSNRREMAALAMLVLSVVLVLAWPLAGLLLVAGLILAFTSTRWTGADKVLATAVYVLLGMPLVVIGGLMAFRTSVATGCTQQMNQDGTTAGPAVCSGTDASQHPWLLVLLAVVVLAIHVYTAVRLYRHARLQATT